MHRNSGGSRAPSGSAASAPELERLAQLLGPLASPVRLRLLRFLATPHYLEEVAAHLGVSRQAARKHLDQLLAIGAILRRPGHRPTGPVVEYLLNPQELFVIQDEFEKLGSLRPRAPHDALLRTMPRPGVPAPAPDLDGPSLAIVRGLDCGSRVSLRQPHKERWLIGRDPRADLAIEHDPWVSNRHAEVRRVADGYVLADLSSTNATSHNWVALPRGGEATLRHGDLVGVGKTLLLFWQRRR